MPIWNRLQELFDEWKAIDYRDPFEDEDNLRAAWDRWLERLRADTDGRDTDPAVPPEPLKPPTS